MLINFGTNTGNSSHGIRHLLGLIFVSCILTSFTLGLSNSNKTQSSSNITVDERGFAIAATLMMPLVTTGNNFGTALTGIGEHCFGERKRDGGTKKFTLLSHGSSEIQKKKSSTEDVSKRSWGCVGQTFNAVFSGVMTLGLAAASVIGAYVKRDIDMEVLQKWSYAEQKHNLEPGFLQALYTLIQSSDTFTGTIGDENGDVLVTNDTPNRSMRVSGSMLNENGKRFAQDVQYTYKHKLTYEADDVSTNPDDYQDWSSSLMNYMSNVEPANSLCLQYWDLDKKNVFLDGYFGIYEDDDSVFTVPPCWKDDHSEGDFEDLEKLQ